MIRIQTIAIAILLILIAPGILCAEKINHCSYSPIVSSENEYSELTPFIDCGDISEEGKLELTEEHFKNMKFNNYGLACLYVNGFRVFYVHKSGKSMETLYFDNGCDYFEEELARGKVNDKIVFFNKKLEVEIQTQFDAALPFTNGYAAVCNGGRTEKIGEHSFMRGGKCGYINRKGKLVVPLRYTRETLPPVNMIESLTNQLSGQRETWRP